MVKKKCEIYASLPITCFEVPIIGHANLNLSTDEIYKCLCAKAEVTEILENGTRINLDFTNYNKDNNPVTHQNEVEEVPPVIKEMMEITENESVEVPEETITNDEVESDTNDEVTIELNDKVEIQDEISEIVEEVIDDKIEETVAEEAVEEPKEVPVAETVKSYQVASRNNNVKKGKNNKKR